MIHINNLRKRFGPQVIFENASAHIKPNERLGLVGPNGAGKTTLLRLIIGDEHPDGGELVITRGTRAGYLRQEVWQNPDRTILAETLAGYPELQVMEQRLNEMESRLSSNHDQRLLDQYGKLRHDFESKGGYEVEYQAKAILSGMGFRPEQFLQPLRLFSGGWMMRVILARLLLSKPNLLLLDEPTNHLDLEAVVWLEGFLLNYPGSIVLISHDQVFMNRLVQRVVEISQKKFISSTGSFESYLQQKALRHEQQEAAFKSQQKQIAQTEEFIERFRYKATKARQVQSRVKMLEKMERVEVENIAPKAIRFRFPQPERSGQEVVRLISVVKRYGEKAVYENLDFILQRGEKVALVGLNGAGKSTLIKIIAGATEIQSGQILFGHNVTVDYYAQHQLEILNPNAMALDELMSVAGHLLPQQARTLLGAFLFHGDDVFKTVSVLSGGEKARLALARMLSRPANLLVMDEPTNHLDIASREVLEKAMAAYDGTMIFISHDRHFINSIANRIVEIRDGRLRSFPGNYDAYLEKKMMETFSPDGIARGGNRPAGTHFINKKEKRRSRAERLQEKHRLLRPLREKISTLESEIAALESEKSQLMETICDPAIMADQKIYPQKVKRHSEVERRLSEVMAEWEQAGQQVAGLEMQFLGTTVEV
jgi:ATP-binding cassette subfamily F protein 3